MSTSSAYSSVLSIYSDNSSLEPEPDYKPPSYKDFPFLNPYAHSLWVDTRGEVGNKTIKGINGENKSKSKSKFELPEKFEFPKRTEFLDTTSTLGTLENVNTSIVATGIFPLRDESLSQKKLSRKDDGHLDSFIIGEEELLKQLRVVQIYKKYLHTKYAHTITARQESQIFGNVEALIDLTNAFLKRLNKSGMDAFFNHLTRLPHVAYPSRDELERCMNPLVWKWLEECEFHTKMRLSQALESPKLMLTQYLKLVDNMLISCDDYEQVEQLYDTKTSLEKLIDLVSQGDIRTDDVPVESVDTEEFKLLMKAFKQRHSELDKVMQSFREMGDPLLRFMQYQKNLTLEREAFMEYEDETTEECYIRSIYHCYYNKLCEQETVTQEMIQKVNGGIIKAIELALESCERVKSLIKRYKYTQAPTLRNQLLDDLPVMINMLSRFEHVISLSYMKHVGTWYGLLSGGRKLKQPGDNFDIIEMFVRARYSTKEAMKEFEDIPTSKVVRRLFGV